MVISTECKQAFRSYCWKKLVSGENSALYLSLVEHSNMKHTTTSKVVK